MVFFARTERVKEGKRKCTVSSVRGGGKKDMEPWRSKRRSKE
jgi:hypothetical protein